MLEMGDKYLKLIFDFFKIAKGTCITESKVEKIINYT